uniref:Phospholipid-transporting ATPase n=1 Tax=Macrostomum lignano TaxID=282301 RepID=A0A1I8HTG6_9PLAT
CWASCCACARREKQYVPRVVRVGIPDRKSNHPANVIRNQKYSVLTFLPLVLFEQFKNFLNFCFLVMALSQFIPQLRIGYLYTYWGPLAFVVSVTMVREAVDDIRRYLRDREVNGTAYERLSKAGAQTVPSSALRVGDVVRVGKNQRVPADLVLLRTSDRQGTCYLRTDQLDGETDWKLRLAPTVTQAVERDEDLLDLGGSVYAERPGRDIHGFIGTLTVARLSPDQQQQPEQQQMALSVENTVWANTVVASGWALGLVVYTGPETRAVMNNSKPRSKFGMTDVEINNITKVLVACVLLLSLALLALKGFGGQWYKYFWRFFLLFSYIVPLALRVNLDVAKMTYSFFIMRDKKLEGNIVRNTTIPEELGRISYLLSDKTGTLTENEMVFKKLHLGSTVYTDEADSHDEVRSLLQAGLAANAGGGGEGGSGGGGPDSVTRLGADLAARTAEAVRAVALCHNVTPVYDEAGADSGGAPAYQASSPDEVALVSWTAEVGLALVHRDQTSMRLRTPAGAELAYTVLHLFPFSSETKRMGIVVRDEATGDIAFYAKGADTVIGALVQPVDWLEEEVGNLAREGLRTLLVAKRRLKRDFYEDWSRRYITFDQLPCGAIAKGSVDFNRYEQARLAVENRSERMQQLQQQLDSGLELLCVTGVEDRLQSGVRPTLETLRNAGVRVWMLTGDKMETACCIAKSSRLVDRSGGLFAFQPASLRSADLDKELRNMARRVEAGHSVVISGECLQYGYYLPQAAVEQDERRFVQLACQAPAVVVCRCSPTQKAEVVRLLKDHTGKRCAAVGDGGNDVAMIQEADCGMGIAGKEGLQASLAADFSIARFQHVTRLMLVSQDTVHGRRCYKNTSVLAQFIVHRGLIISTMQAAFSAVFFYVAISLFPGILMIGYATIFTMFPVFSLVLDKDVASATAEKFPELYRDLLKGRELSAKLLCIWVAISIYQGGVIMYGSIWLFQGSFLHIVSIGFTALVFTELIMVALTVRTWCWQIIVAELVSLCSYLAAVFILTQYFDRAFILTLNFLWKVSAITAVSSIPIVALKLIRYLMSPPIARKLQA